MAISPTIGAMMFIRFILNAKLIKKRRWLHEFPLILEPADSKKLDGTISAIGGKIPKLAKNAFTRKKIKNVIRISEDIKSVKAIHD